MSAYQTFAIWGAGNLGGRIAENLLQRKETVIILTRPESAESAQNQAFAAKGAEIRPFDVASADAVSTLHGIDVLLSTPGIFALGLQSKLVDHAAAAGVKLFVPSEFGDTTDGRTEPVHILKTDHRTQAAKLGMPTVAFFTGLWSEFLIYRGYELSAKKITIFGVGDTPVSATSLDDVAYFVVFVLTTLPRERLENAKFQIQGDSFTFNELAKSIQEVSSEPFEVVHVPRSDLEEKLKADPSDVVAGLFLGFENGLGLHPNPLSNGLVKDHRWKKAIDVLRPLIP